MTSTPSEEMELNKKHEEILGQRAVLLLQMESQYEQQRRTRKQQVMMSQVALERNAQLLQGLQEMENRHGTKQLPHPEILTLETRYWASVEEKIPEWERFLLGKGPHPSSNLSRTSKPPTHKANLRDKSLTKDKAVPPYQSLKYAK